MSFLHWLFGKPNKKPNLIEPPQDVIPANQNQEDSNKTDCFSFFVDQPRIADYTHLGMSVNLWIPKVNNPDKVYIYHRNGPAGCIGIVPSKYSNIVISHLKNALDYEAKIEELTENECKIKCRLISKTKTERREEEYKESLKKELTKAYNRKKPITLMLATKQKETVKKGDKLLIEFNDLDSYLQDAKVQSCQWHLKFLNQTGETIGIFDNDKNTIKKILKAHFNSYLFDIEVSDTFTHLDYSEEKERSNWKGYPIQLVITPYKSSNTTVADSFKNRPVD
ncbi:MAG: hypothetical protein V2B13_18395 [Pseudomonadota bacterium]